MTEPTLHEDYPAIDSRAFRDTMGRFATGITVVTTVVENAVHGMTANAFLSVSLEPPLILVSVDRRARMHGFLERSGRYGVSILSAQQQAYSQHFAGRPVEGLELKFVWVHDMPLLAETLGHMVATVVEAHPAGDHTLFIGRVEYLRAFDGEPLIFFRGQYRHLEPSP